MFQPLEDCINSFVKSSVIAGFEKVSVTNYRVEREGDRMFVVFEADLNEGKNNV
jgi:hypothetical protein